MNNIYLYKYESTGLQFTSTATLPILIASGKFAELPKQVGCWKYKKIKLPPSDVSMFRS